MRRCWSCAFAGLGAMLDAIADRGGSGLSCCSSWCRTCIAVTHFAMWWGGHSAPARFFVPMLPLLAIPAGVGWTRIRHRATRATVVRRSRADGLHLCVARVRRRRPPRVQRARDICGVARMVEQRDRSGARYALRGGADARRSCIEMSRSGSWSFAAAWVVLASGRGQELAARVAARSRPQQACAYAAAAMVALTIVWTLAGVRRARTSPRRSSKSCAVSGRSATR